VAVADKAKDRWGSFRTRFKLGVGVKLAGIASYEKRMKSDLSLASENAMMGKHSDEQALSAEEERSQYLEEGDARLYTSAALKKRRGLRSREDIGLYIRKLWRAIAHDTSAACDGELRKDGYFRFNVSLFKALMPEFDVKDAQVAAEEDWINDVGDTGTGMSYGAFFDSVFELVDVWSPSLEPQDYIHFLRKLAIGIMIWEWDSPPELRHHKEVPRTPSCRTPTLTPTPHRRCSTMRLPRCWLSQIEYMQDIFTGSSDCTSLDSFLNHLTPPPTPPPEPQPEREPEAQPPTQAQA